MSTKTGEGHSELLTRNGATSRLARGFVATLSVLVAGLMTTLLPLSERGAMLGINNAMFTLAGPFAPMVMGVIIDAGAVPPERFRVVFIATGACVTAGALVSLVLINPERI